MTAAPMPYNPDPFVPKCPNCRQLLTEKPPWPSRCHSCKHKIGFFTFNPVAREEHAPQAAMPDDVTCAFHPTKKAEQVCAGTGSYICALCAITVGATTYSAEFINQGGLKNIGKGDLFERTLARPDIVVWTCILAMFFLAWTLVGAPIMLVVAGIYFVKHLRMRRENSLYAKVTSPVSTALMAIILSLTVLLGLFFLIAVFLEF